MKQIKGKIDFLVIPVIDNKEERVVDFEKDMPQFTEVPWFYLNTIEESEASLFVNVHTNEFAYPSGERSYVYVNYLCPSGLVNLGDKSKHFRSAKESLVSLLKANDCWIKDWKVNPNKMSYEYKYYFNSQQEALDDYNKTPDDFLIIKTK